VLLAEELIFAILFYLIFILTQQIYGLLFELQI
jgi:hypothetical protein